MAFVCLLVALVLLDDSGRGQWLFRLAAVIPLGDKVGHVVLFGILSFLANLLSRAQTFKLHGFAVLKWSGLLMVLVTLEEFSQLLFRSRSFDVLDLVSDAVGIWLFGRLAVVYLNRKRRALRSGSVIPPAI